MSCDAYETSSAQKRLYIINDLLGDSILYNENRVWIIHGNLDPTRLENAIKQISQRHESLRTCFLMKDGEVLQKVYDYIDVDFKYSQYTPVDIETVIDDFLEPYSLGKVPLWKVELAQVGENRQLILMDFHHIIADGISMDVFIEELQALYLGVELPEPEIQYVDFVIWQNDLFAGERIKKQEAYWMDLFEGEIPVLDLPTDFPRPLQGDITGTSIEFEMDETLTARVNQLGARSNTTLYVVLLTVFNVLLAKYSNQEDIVIGTPTSGRTHQEFQKVIGMFVNTLAMRNRPKARKTFTDFLNEVYLNVFDAFENQDYQFEMLVEKLAPERQLNRNPLFDVLFVLQNFLSDINISGRGNEEMAIIPYSLKRRASKFDLTLQVFEGKRRIAFMLDYRVSLFRPDTMDRLKEHFFNILREVSENPGVLLSDIRMISDAEAEQLLYVLNDTAVDFPIDKTVHQLFEEQVERKPDGIAIQLTNRTYRTYRTYKELNEKSNQLAHLLRKKGVKPGSIVGIMIEPSFQTVVAILAVLKAGGGYLPIESKYPAQRIAYMLKDSSTAVLLGRNHLPENVNFEGEILFLDNDIIFNGSLDNPAASVGPGDVVYTIYTSGSTGMPKGVVLMHKNLVNYVNWFSGAVGVSESDRALLTSSLAFDLGYTVLYPSLLKGGEFHIIPRETYLFAEHLLDYIAANKITYIKITPSLFATLVDEPGFTSERCQSMRAVVLGGEAIIAGDVQKAFNRCKGIRIMNHYGPTESTIGSIAQFIDVERIEEYVQTPTIGSPIHNTRVYILDKYLKLVPVKVAGELFIAGHGLARGYLNQPELTAERFIEFHRSNRSYRSYISYRSYRTYRTGDLGRWLPGGRIEFLGRVDHQVKIRGYRIEMGEIENHLLTHETVKEAAVLTRKNKEGVHYLAAYIVTEKNEAFDTGAMKDYLAARLPDYMIPSFFIQLEKVLVTPNGKLDRRALPEYDVKADQVYQPPADETEKKLAEIWSGVLGIEEDALSVDANFFDLGGQSLSAAVVIARTHKALHVRIPMAELFKTPTIKGLSGYIKKAAAERYASIEAAEKKEYYGLSFAQKRLYVLQQMEPGSIVYNMPYIIGLSGVYHMEKLERTFIQLIERYESFRTSFLMKDDEPVQRIHQRVEFKMEGRGTLHGPLSIEDVIRDFIRPFDLSHAPLLRAGLIKRREEEYILMMDMHHIISDQISQEIFAKEFIALYTGEEESPPPLRIQYKDYTEWQDDEKQKQIRKRQEEYWLKEFEGEIPLLNLPTDYKKPGVLSFKGSTVPVMIAPSLTLKIKKYTSRMGVTVMMFLFALYKILLSRFAGQEELVAGTVIAGRHHADFENIIGFFVNMLAIKTGPAKHSIFSDYLMEVKNKTLNAFENQDYPFEELVNKLGIQRQAGRHPLVDAVFAFQEKNQQDREAGEIRAKLLDFNLFNVAHFDLMLYLTAVNDSISGVFEYSTDLFKRSTIEGLSNFYIEVLEQIVENPDIALEEIRTDLNLLPAKSTIKQEDDNEWDL